MRREIVVVISLESELLFARGAWVRLREPTHRSKEEREETLVRVLDHLSTSKQVDRCLPLTTIVRPSCGTERTEIHIKSPGSC